MESLLLTGGAGFIGFHLAAKLIANPGLEVFIIDNLNAYYDPALKGKRLQQLGFADFSEPGWVSSQYSNRLHFCRVDIADETAMDRALGRLKANAVIHLAAQAGVRYSFDAPRTYIGSNLTGFYNVMEWANRWAVRHFIFASSSSVYGANQKVPFFENDSIVQPLNLYAATKGANELLAYANASLYGTPTSGLRFFTVYGPYGRPDMAYYKFAKAILQDRPIDVHNNGQMKRDFTFVDDITKAMVMLLGTPPLKNPPYEVYNLGNNRPVELMQFIRTLEECLGKKAVINMVDGSRGEMSVTCADIQKLERAIGYSPSTELNIGLKKFVDWFLAEHAPEN
ncbi:MAG: NAD-dependent epimerase/dehydratase family protein [Saprospiraceae bacterium]|jgi:UDP-glucuronate 4-epimerase|nr:NAD-dependent epimerase/dehydratase family protein [Saprospiraceae bacterium]MBP9209174.1 NAD-dependent epimerase/dehydratase family protein [Saprospiraceae bacterium]MBV6472950.1 dTDP-glucose 4,6-dehydratase [Saprospiraceae bacterium]